MSPARPVPGAHCTHVGSALRYRSRMRTFTRAAALSAGCLCLLASLSAQPADENAASARLIEELGLRESAVALRDRPGWAPPKKVVLMDADAARAAWMQEAAPGGDDESGGTTPMGQIGVRASVSVTFDLSPR